MFGDRINTSSVVRWYQLIFTAWLVTLPFGANLLPVSLGFFTIYPNLIFSFLGASAFFFAWKKLQRLDWIVISIAFIWLVYAIIQGVSAGMDSFALFDIRSLVLQLVFTLVLICNAHLLTDFRYLLIRGIRLYLGILIFFGVFEFLTGIHFAGNTTKMFLDLPVGNIFYTPLFIYDNPNDYLLYTLFFVILLRALDQEFRNALWLQAILIVVLFVFATYADSRFSKMVLVLVCCWIYFPLVYKDGINAFKKIGWAGFGFLALLLVCFSKPLFFGPKYGEGKSYRLNAVQQVDTVGGKLRIRSLKDVLSPSERNLVIDALDSANVENPNGATNLRANLMLEGMEHVKKFPLTGSGPGGFRRLINKGGSNHYVAEHVSPHNAVLEMISQYGWMGWIYLLFIAFLGVLFFLRFRSLPNSEIAAWLLLLFSLPIFWMMPSAYLYLDLQWYLLPILIIGFRYTKTIEA